MGNPLKKKDKEILSFGPRNETGQSRNETRNESRNETGMFLTYGISN